MHQDGKHTASGKGQRIPVTLQNLAGLGLRAEEPGLPGTRHSAPQGIRCMGCCWRPALLYRVQITLSLSQMHIDHLPWMQSLRCWGDETTREEERLPV